MKQQEYLNQGILYTTWFLPSLLSSLPFFLCSSSPYLLCLCFIMVGSDVVQAALQLLDSQGLPCIPDPPILASRETQASTTISAFLFVLKKKNERTMWLPNKSIAPGSNFKISSFFFS